MGNQRLSRRTVLLQAAAAGIATMGGGALLSGCAGADSGTSFADAKSSGKIKIGYANEAPYGFTDPAGRLTGQAPEVARAILRKLGITEIEAVLADFRQLIPGLKAKRYAFVAAGMFINPERCANATFSIPDYQVESAFMVPKGNPEGIHQFADIKGKDILVAVLTGAVELGYAIEAGVPEEQIVTLGDQDSIFRAVRDGRVYGAATLDTTVGYLLKQNPDANLEKTEPFRGSEAIPGVGGFTFPKGETEFVRVFNTELKKMKDSGEWLEIVKPFGFTERHLPPKDLTTERLCEK